MKISRRLGGPVTVAVAVYRLVTTHGVPTNTWWMGVYFCGGGKAEMCVCANVQGLQIWVGEVYAPETGSPGEISLISIVRKEFSLLF